VHVRASAREDDVRRRRLELLRCQRLQSLTYAIGRDRDRSVDRHRATAGEGPAAGRRDRGVGRHEAHALHRDAEAIGDHLGDRRRVPLPLRGEARGAADAAVGVHRERGRLHAGEIRQPAAAKSLGAHARVLRVARQADAHEPARRAGGGLLTPQRRVVRQIERLLERLGEIAAVVDEAARRHPRIGFGRDQVAAAHLGRIELQALGHHVEDALHHERAHRHPDSAIRTERGLVGPHRQGFPRIGFDPVGARQDRRGAERLECRRERIDVERAAVGDHTRAQPAHPSRLIGGDVDGDSPLARVDRRGEVLLTLLDPLHRAPETARRRGHRHVLGQHVDLQAEAAAHVGDDDPHA
jgi:hypothetical protein